MTTEQQDLIDRAMVQLGLVQSANVSALAAVQEGNLLEARTALADTSNHANHARRALRLAGARIPSLDDRPSEEKYDLGELAALDSAAGKNLLAGLGELQGFADAYDRERGKSLPSGRYNILDSGTDFGEALQMLRSRLRQLLGLNVGAGRE
jgi:hypothetical protein